MMKRLIDYITLSMAGSGLLLLVACDAEQVTQDSPASRVPIEVYLNADSGVSPYSTEAGTNAFLLFWDENGYNTWVSEDDASATPAFTCTQTGTIDDYTYESGVAYQVPHEYLPNNAYYYAAGYAPAGALTPSADYTTLTVDGDYQDGTADFLSCDAKEAHCGSATDRFIEEEHELQFRHLTARIRFVGVREEVMWGKMGVNNVRITLGESNGLCVPTEFQKKVNGDATNPQSTYIASEMSEPQSLTIDGTSEYIPATNDGLTLGSCYVLYAELPDGYDPFADPNETNGSINLTFNIEADLSYVMGAGEYIEYRTAKWTGQTVIIQSNTGDTLYPGYEYVVEVTFKNESISLQGIQKKWENGGTHYLPITPPSDGQ